MEVIDTFVRSVFPWPSWAHPESSPRLRFASPTLGNLPHDQRLLCHKTFHGFRVTRGEATRHAPRSRSTGRAADLTQTAGGHRKGSSTPLQTVGAIPVGARSPFSYGCTYLSMLEPGRAPRSVGRRVSHTAGHRDLSLPSCGDHAQDRAANFISNETGRVGPVTGIR